MTITSPEIIFGSKRVDSKIYNIFYSILIFLLSPFHATILHIKEYYIQLQLRSNPDNIELNLKRDKLRNCTSKFVKLELGLEAGFQFTGQLILFLLTFTETETIGKTEVQKLEIDQTFLILSLIGSFIGCLFSYMKGISMNREHFPVVSKIMVLSYVKFALLTKVLSIVMYFTPVLGLFNVLQHWKYEQIPWNNDVIKELIDPIDHTIKLPTGVIEWKDINRWTKHLDGSLKSPDYTLYTVFRLKHYFMFFWILIAFHIIIIYQIKKWNLSFQKLTWLEKIIHAMENVLTSANTNEWDSGKGNSNEHKLRMLANENEMSALIVVSTVFNCLLMAPMCILGNIFLMSLPFSKFNLRIFL